VSLRSGEARGQVRGSIAQGAFFFCFFSFGRAKEKKKAFRDGTWAITPPAGQRTKQELKVKMVIVRIISVYLNEASFNQQVIFR
jgi:hypothetical protein